MIRDYVSIARPNHFFKQLFMVPGVLVAWLAAPPDDVAAALAWVALGVLATCVICSSSYTLNEILDAKDDRRHPDKRSRPAASGRIRPAIGYAQWAGLGAAGLGLSWIVSPAFFAVAAVLLAMGIIYNVKPLRSKDWPYLDVLSESVNNPLRFLLGWYAAMCPLMPSLSLLLSYWMLGAYFMAIKRFEELQHFDDPATAAAYRRSFAHYTPQRLLVSIIFYATAAALFGGIFLIRYHVEMILAVPFLAGFMAYYMRLGLLPDSPTQRPEGLYKHWDFVIYTFLTATALVACLIIRLPWLSELFKPTLPTGP